MEEDFEKDNIDLQYFIKIMQLFSSVDPIKCFKFLSILQRIQDKKQNLINFDGVLMTADDAIQKIQEGELDDE